jgi:hypothetical protein
MSCPVIRNIAVLSKTVCLFTILDTRCRNPTFLRVIHDSYKSVSTSDEWHKSTWDGGDITPVILCLVLDGGGSSASNTVRFVLGE